MDMSLRVLLADESPNIKKVMQITLQDYGVELKTVQLGVDVLTVAQQFKPDIIFVDILLQKKNGYEVCQDLKQDSNLQTTPVILMWSGFMDIDDSKVQEVGANDKIEKPFDTETLRNVIKKYVPITQGQNLEEFLDFPNTPKQEERTQKAAEVQAKKVPPPPPSSNKAQNQDTGQKKPSWNMDSFEDIQNFEASMNDEDSPFSSGSNDEDEEIDQFQKVKLNKVDLQKDSHIFDDEPMIELDLSHHNEDEVSREELLSNVYMGENEPKAQSKPNVKAQPHLKKTQDVQVPAMSIEEIETIIRAQSKEIIEQLVYKLVPDIATKIVKEELQRLIEEPKL